MNQTQSCLQGRLDRSINAWIMGRMKRKMPTGLIGTERGRELMKDQQKPHARFLNFFFLMLCVTQESLWIILRMMF